MSEESDPTTDDDSDDVQDPVLQYCTQCGTANDTHLPPEGFGHHCRECGAFVPTATDHQAWLLGKRMEQGILHEQGYVTVGGYTPGVHGPEYGAATAAGPQGGEAGV